MRKEEEDWACQLKNKRILHSFSLKKTPTQARSELGIKKFNLQPYLKRGLIKCLTSNCRKGRLYVITNKAREILKITLCAQNDKVDYDLIGWIFASPKQRYVVLKTLSKNSGKHTSEQIRIKSSNLNQCLSRISTKAILKELLKRDLIDTEMGNDRMRYYWINDKGKSLASEL